MPNSPEISIVSPVYNGEGIVNELIKRLNSSLSELTDNFEIILVDDGSADQSWEEIKRFCSTNKNIKGIKLSRNFGQHKAITAGLDKAKGTWIVVMDCDLQDKPEEIKKLYQKAQQGYDIVLAKRVKRQDNFFKKLSSRIFYNVFEYLTGVPQDSTVANFGIYHQKVIRILVNDMRESIRVFPMMMRWVGFKITSEEVEHGAGIRTKSTYTFNKLLDLAFNAMLTFSEKPLKLAVKLGLLVTLLALVYGIYTVIRVYQGHIGVAGWPSVIVSIWFLGGVIIFILGIVGLYLGKTFEEVKKRPIYIIDEIVSNE